MMVYITGTESFVGKELVHQCESQGIDVVGIDLIKNNKPNFYQMDVCSKNIVELVPEEVDAIIHLAAMSRDSDCKNNAYECFDINVMGTLNLINAASIKRAKQFIFASTEWVYDSFNGEEIKDEDSFININKHISEYALSKLVSEVNLKQKYMHGFCAVTILRFGIIYGQRKSNWSAVESIFNSVATKNEVIIGSLRTSRHFIHVSDIASSIVKSIGLEGFEILNIQSDKLISLGDVIETSKKLLGRNPTIYETSPNKPVIRRISNQKALKLIGWRPNIDLDTGLLSVKDFLEL